MHINRSRSRGRTREGETQSELERTTALWPANRTNGFIAVPCGYFYCTLSTSSYGSYLHFNDPLGKSVRAIAEKLSWQKIKSFAQHKEPVNSVAPVRTPLSGCLFSGARSRSSRRRHQCEGAASLAALVTIIRKTDTRNCAPNGSKFLKLLVVKTFYTHYFGFAFVWLFSRFFPDAPRRPPPPLFAATFSACARQKLCTSTQSKFLDTSA